MTSNHGLMDRSIIEEFKLLFEPNEHVHSMWIAGSVADGYADELSDIDLFLDITDGKDAEIYEIIERHLQTKGGLDTKLGRNLDPPFTHRVYHLKGANPFHFIEFTLHAHSHKYNPYEGSRKAIKIFDKVGFLNQDTSETLMSDEDLVIRKQKLLDKIEVGYISVEKEILRGNFTDALHNYEFWLRTPMIEIIRIKHSPQKTSFGLKHGSRDLPQQALDDIEAMCQISTIEAFRDRIDLIMRLVKEYY